MNRDYYVYACEVNGNLVYIGKGKDNRLDHCTSGISSCKELNEDLFRYGKYKFNVFKVVDGLTEEQAFAMEKAAIMWHQQDKLYNRTYGENSKQTCDDQLALEFIYWYCTKTVPRFRWNDEPSIFD